MTECPCGLKKEYDDCCGAFISGASIPKTPEELMRSRYTAFTQAKIDYIGKTMKGSALKDFDKPGTKQWAEQSQWLGLEIIKSSANGNTGAVEFIAQYRQGKKLCKIHELSKFSLENGRWYYIDGQIIAEKAQIHTSNRIGRNDKCPCGSGKKYKKCCDIICNIHHEQQKKL